MSKNEHPPSKTQLHVSVRIDYVTPGHVTFTIWEGLAYEDDTRPLHTLTRGHIGQITMDREAAPKFIGRMMPVQITARDREEVCVTESLPSSTMNGYVQEIARAVREIIESWQGEKQAGDLHFPVYEYPQMDAMLQLLYGDRSMRPETGDGDNIYSEVLSIYSHLVNMHNEITGKLGAPKLMRRMSDLSRYLQDWMVGLTHNRGTIVTFDHPEMIHNPLYIQGPPEWAARYIREHFTCSMLLKRAFVLGTPVPLTVSAIYDSNLPYQGYIWIVTEFERVRMARFTAAKIILNVVEEGEKGGS